MTGALLRRQHRRVGVEQLPLQGSQGPTIWGSAGRPASLRMRRHEFGPEAVPAAVLQQEAAERKARQPIDQVEQFEDRRIRPIARRPQAAVEGGDGSRRGMRRCGVRKHAWSRPRSSPPPPSPLSPVPPQAIDARTAAHLGWVRAMPVTHRTCRRRTKTCSGLRHTNPLTTSLPTAKLVTFCTIADERGGRHGISAPGITRRSWPASGLVRTGPQIIPEARAGGCCFARPERLVPAGRFRHPPGLPRRNPNGKQR